MVGFGKDFGATRRAPTAASTLCLPKVTIDEGLGNRDYTLALRLARPTLWSHSDYWTCRSLGGDEVGSALIKLQRGMVEAQKYMSNPLRPYLWFLPVRRTPSLDLLQSIAGA